MLKQRCGPSADEQADGLLTLEASIIHSFNPHPSDSFLPCCEVPPVIPRGNFLLLPELPLIENHDSIALLFVSLFMGLGWRAARKTGPPFFAEEGMDY